MTLLDTALALLLAARIHRSDAAVRATARRCVKRLPRSKRDVIFQVIDSHSPLVLVELMAGQL